MEYTVSVPQFDYDFVIRYSKVTEAWHIYKRVKDRPITSHWQWADSLIEAFKKVAQVL